MPQRLALFAQRAPATLFLVLAATIYLGSWIVRSLLAWVPEAQVVAYALTFDVALGVPLLYYLLLVRRKGWPALSVVPVFLLSLAGATWMVPAGHTGFLEVLLYSIVPLEFLVLGYIGYQAYRGVKHFQHAKGERRDAYTAIQQTAARLLKVDLASRPLAYEVAVLYYAFATWRQPVPEAPHLFSYHRKVGYGTVLIGLSLAMLIELVSVHVFVAYLGLPMLAWILSALSVYGFFWLFGDYRAIVLRPIEVQADRLRFRVGIRSQADIPFAAIADLQQLNHKSQKLPGQWNAILLGTPKFRLTLTSPHTFESLYGMPRKVKLLGFSVDDPERFADTFTEAYQRWQRQNP